MTVRSVRPDGCTDSESPIYISFDCEREMLTDEGRQKSDEGLRRGENDLNDMLNSLYDLPVPKPFTPVNLSVHSYFIAPDINGLPTIPESRNLTEYFVAVDVNNMLQLFASMLHERRIIITSSKLSTSVGRTPTTIAPPPSVSFICRGPPALEPSLCPAYRPNSHSPAPAPADSSPLISLFSKPPLPSHPRPLSANSPKLPTLPEKKRSRDAPMPYFVGVHLSLLERVRSRSLEDVVILNVDTNTLESPFDDLHNLPSDVVSSLKSKLKKQSTATGSGVARAFMRAQAALFGSYRDALRYKPPQTDKAHCFTLKEFRASLKYVRIMLIMRKHEFEMTVGLFVIGLQWFIDGRLAKLNAGRGFSDVFEEEITEGGFCGSNSRSYQQWMQRGGALFNTAVTKAKSHAKRGIRDIKGRLKAREEEEEGIPVCAGSPTSTKSLSPRRLQKMRRQNFNKSPMSMGPRDLGYGLDDDELDNASKISSEDSGDVPSYTEDSDDSYSLDLDIDSSNSGQMNLLEEILDSLNTTTVEQGKLSAAKSLDFFRSMEDLDYKTPSKPTTSRESEPANESSCGGGGDQGSWNMGQDDSAVHGKHPSPVPTQTA
ncbi:DENN domain-containing protein 1B [Larimichthys crocea]|uniref:Uncharacterized protein n=1 Tax=Larimichthys crocea TaxID=215358 RepID=A0ACD3RMC5_LARCR|nr:DENN domain-containing protein 1B [Larimichthys crocea]